MNILYVNPGGFSGPTIPLLARRGYKVTAAASSQEALEIIGSQHFSAVLISEEIEDSEAFDFIHRVHREQPELLVFQLSVWHSELAETLELLEAIEKGGDAPK